METPNKQFIGICLDFETGGLCCQTCAITQISMQAFRFDTMEVIDSFVRYIYPYSQESKNGQEKKVLHKKVEQKRLCEIPMKYEEEALKVTGISMELLYEQGVPLKEVAQQVLDFVSKNTLTRGCQYKPILIGHHIAFDIGFLEQMMTYANLRSDFEHLFSGDKDFFGNFHPTYIDTIQIAHLALASEPSLCSYKLEFLAEFLGIELDDAHNAEADVATTLDILRLFVRRLRNQVGDTISRNTDRIRNHFKI